MADVLVLYAREDQWCRDWVEEQLHSLLETHDYLELSYWDYPAKRRFRKKVRATNEARFQQADVLLVFLSKSFLRSGLYANYLKRRVQIHDNKTVIPLLVNLCFWRQEAFFKPVAGEIGGQTPLNYLRSRGELHLNLRGVQLEGRLLADSWKAERVQLVKGKYIQQQLERRRREKERRLARWISIVAGALVVSLLLSLAVNASQCRGPDPGGAEPPPIRAEQPPHRRPESSRKQSTPPDYLEPEKQTSPPPPKHSTVDASPSPPPAQRFRRLHHLGENRLAGLQNAPLGWILLDLDTLPVIPILFRRMDLHGFKNGRLKVKQGDEIFFIGVDGQRVDG